MRIAYIPSDMDAPGSYRCLFPGRMLREKAEVDVVLPKRKLIDGPDGRKKWMFDVHVDPPVPMAHIWVLQSRFERHWAEQDIQKLRQWGVITVADVDDNYEELPYWNPAFYGTHPYRRDDGVIVSRSERRKIAKSAGWKRMPPNKQNRLWLRETLKQVDHVTVSTPYLRDLYLPVNPNISVVRNYVDWEMWKYITPQCEVEREGERIRVGYPGVFRYRQGDLAVIKPWIGKWMLKHPNVDFVANTEAVHDFLDIPAGQRVTVGEYDFLDIETMTYPMPESTATFDIGLVPLAPGGMSEAKSHLKGMEMNAAGIPYIASNTESYRYYTIHEDWEPNGFIADSQLQWIDRLNELVEDDAKRREMGDTARSHAYDNSIQQNWREWLSVYEGIYGDEYTQMARTAIAKGSVQKASELGPVLREAAQGKLDTVVEIGSARGGTFWAFSQIASDDAMMVSIDIPGGSPIDVRDGEDVYSGRDRDRFKTLVRASQKLRLIDLNSHEDHTLAVLKHTLQGRKIDLLFIDGDHRYEGVKRDYEMYSPLVRPGGLIVFHDMIPQNDPRSGVHKLWNELKDDRDKSQSSFAVVAPETWGWGKWGGCGVLVA